jgi:gamma-glutamyltranspeptidase
MLLNGKAPLPGQIMKFPNLARTFRAVAEQGKDGFYKGRIAEAIVELIQSKGGVMELDDLAKHETSFVEPIKYTYAGEVTVYEVSSQQFVSWALFNSNNECSVLPMVKVKMNESPPSVTNVYRQASLHCLLLAFLNKCRSKERSHPCWN